MLFGLLAASAQTTNQFLYTGSKTNITLPPGTYDITAYGAQGGQGYTIYFYGGGGVFTGGASFGAEMEAEFNFPTQTTLTLLVGAAGTNGGASSWHSGGGGGGGSFVVNGGTALLIAGGGGGAGGGNGGVGSGYNGNIGADGGSGAGGYPYGGSGGSNGSGGGYPPDITYFDGQNCGGGGGGGYNSDGGSQGPYNTGSGGYGGSSYLDGGVGGAGNFPAAFGGNGGYGGGGGGGIPIGANGGFGGGGGGGYSGGGGGSGLDDTFIGAGGGGGSIIDASAVAIFTEISGVASPDDSPNGEIIIIAVPQPTTLTLATTAGGQFGFNVTGPTNATIVVESCTNLASPVWIPMATNTFASGSSYFSDSQWTNYPDRFYRVHSP